MNTINALSRNRAPLHDSFDRPARALADDEILKLGTRSVRWLDTPHLPHAWECGYLMEEHTRTLLCGDLFTRGGTDQLTLFLDSGHPSYAARAFLA